MLNGPAIQTDTGGMFRRAVSGLGRSLITTGVLLLLFVVYQLWGTGIATASSQRGLQKDLEEKGLVFGDVPTELTSGDGSGVVTIPVISSPVETIPETLPLETTLAPSTTSEPIADPNASTTVAVPPTTKFAKELVSRSKTKRVKIATGEAIGRIVIPRISVDDVIVSGADKKSLEKGPGHYIKTPLPGEPGNTSIACHRTTFGAPCFRVDELKVGDRILIASATSGRWFTYNVTEKRVVKPSQNEVLLNKEGRNTLTLTTCHPQYSAKQRLIIVADLVGEAVESDIEFVQEDPLADQLKAQRDAKLGITTTAASTVPAPTTELVEPTFVGDDPTITTAETADTTVAVAPTTPATPGDGEDGLGEEALGDEEATLVNGVVGKTYKVWFFKGTANAWMHSLGWAAACAAIWLGVWFFAHDRKKLFLRAAMYAGGFALIFLPALYFCFVNISRMLPEAV